MKKVFAILLAVCLLCSVSALADMPEPETVLDELVYSVLPANNMLVRQVGDGLVLCDLAGNTVGGPYQCNNIYESSGVIKAKGQGREFGTVGILNEQGEWIVPLAYDYIKTSGKWAIACEYGMGTEEDHDESIFVYGEDTAYRILEKAVLYDMSTGAQVASFTGRQVVNIATLNDWVNLTNKDNEVTASFDPEGNPRAELPSSVYDFPVEQIEPRVVVDYSEEGCALMTADGELLTGYDYEIIFETSFYTQDYGEAGDEDYNYGLLSITGELVVPMAFEDILMCYPNGSYAFETCGVFAAKTEDAFYLISDGNVVEVPADDIKDYGYDFTGTCLLLETEDDTCRIVRPDGTVIELSPDYGYVMTVNLGARVFFTTYDDANGSGSVLLDDMGNVLLEQVGSLTFTADGHLIVYNDGKTMVYDMLK